RKMSVAVSRAAALRCTHARCVERINEIHIHSNVNTSGIQRCDFHGLMHHFSQPALIQLAHSEYPDAERFKQLAFAGVDTSCADDSSILRQYFGCKAGYVS